MITYRASLDVPATTLEVLTRWLAAPGPARYPSGAARRPRPGAGAAGPALVQGRHEAADPALDAELSIAAAYRYLHEVIDVIADRAPTLGQALERGHAADWPHL